MSRWANFSDEKCQSLCYSKIKVQGFGSWKLFQLSTHWSLSHLENILEDYGVIMEENESKQKGTILFIYVIHLFRYLWNYWDTKLAENQNERHFVDASHRSNYYEFCLAIKVKKRVIFFLLQTAHQWRI